MTRTSTHGVCAGPRTRAGLQRAGYGIETGVQDGGVGLRCAVADVVRGFDEGGTQPLAGQFAGNRGADDACADDGHVICLRARRLVRRFAGQVGRQVSVVQFVA